MMYSSVHTHCICMAVCIHTVCVRQCVYTLYMYGSVYTHCVYTHCVCIAVCIYSVIHVLMNNIAILSFTGFFLVFVDFLYCREI